MRRSADTGSVGSRSRVARKRTVVELKTPAWLPETPKRTCKYTTINYVMAQSGLAGALGGADQHPAPRAPGQNQRPAPRAPERPGSRPGFTIPGHPPDIFCPGLTRGQGYHARESRSGAASRVLAYRVPPCAHTRAAQVRIRTLRLHAMRHATTSNYF